MYRDGRRRASKTSGKSDYSHMNVPHAHDSEEPKSLSPEEDIYENGLVKNCFLFILFFSFLCRANYSFSIVSPPGKKPSNYYHNSAYRKSKDSQKLAQLIGNLIFHFTLNYDLCSN
jgi:hypothetical protein